MTDIQMKREREKKIVREMITLTATGTMEQRKVHKVHCYKPDMKEKIRKVMRWSGPRIIFHHPVMATRHVIESSREKKKWK